jgi:uncharacterized protein
LPEQRSCSHSESTSATPPDSLEELAGALRRPEAYPHGPDRVEMRQTQMSLLFFAGDFVYKVKKPVNLGYLDYTSLAGRKRFCEREVELNRRLCDRTYLGVVPISRSPHGLAVEGTGEPVEYAVKMRRLPQERMLDRLLADGHVSTGMIQSIAARVAAFHAAAASTPEISGFGGIDVIRRNTDENFAQTLPYIGRTVTDATHESLRRFTNDFLGTHLALLSRRVKEGRIRDCHGDLHAAHVCMTDEVCVYDCIEFNDRFRYGDVASEVAFLAMDLDRFRRRDLSKAFADSYVAISNDSGVAQLLQFYKCYRAVVRGKVEGFKLGDKLMPDDEQRAAAWLARTYFELARRYATGKGLLVLMSGVTASGKSMLAQRLGDLLAGTVLSSDVVRKQLAGLSPEEHRYEPFGQGIYSHEWTRRTYDELLRQATALMAGGGCVILDASFLHVAERTRAIDAARRASSRIVAVECVAPREELLRRLTLREAEATVSDGRIETLDGQLALLEPVNEFPAGDHVVANTTHDIETLMEEIWPQL